MHTEGNKVFRGSSEDVRLPKSPGSSSRSQGVPAPTSSGKENLAKRRSIALQCLQVHEIGPFHRCTYFSSHVAVSGLCSSRRPIRSSNLRSLLCQVVPRTIPKFTSGMRIRSRRECQSRHQGGKR